jgi:hypothetical protein
MSVIDAQPISNKHCWMDLMVLLTIRMAVPEYSIPSKGHVSGFVNPICTENEVLKILQNIRTSKRTSGNEFAIND